MKNQLSKNHIYSRIVKLFFVSILILNVNNAIAQWVIFDGSVPIAENGTGWTMRKAGNVDVIDLVTDDPDIAENQFYNLGSSADETNFQYWRKDGEYPNNSATFIIKFKAYSSEINGVIYVESSLFGNNEKVRIHHSNIKMERGEPIDKAVPDGINLDTDFMTLRITYDDDNTSTIYINEETDPFLGPHEGRDAGDDNFISIGDGSTSTPYGAVIDWIAIDTTGAYAPEEGSPVPEILLDPTFEPPVSISENISESLIKIYPVPATNLLNVELSKTLIKGDVKIYDAIGKQIFQGILNNSRFNLDVSHLNNGIYMVKIIDTMGGVYVKQFIKK